MKLKAVFLALVLVGTAHAETTIQVHSVSSEGIGASIGRITVSESKHGLVLTPDLKELPPGEHGFHLHQNPSCEPGTKDGKMQAAISAGGHFDPKGAGNHGAPWGKGHLGDLPPLHVDQDGTATRPVLAPRLKMKQLPGHALMIHAGGDNFADQPAPLGGGGARIACGVFK